MNGQTNIIVQKGRYSVRREDVAHSYSWCLPRYTLWGPDVNGRICRMGDYGEAGHRAMEAFRLLSEEEEV